MRLRTQEPQPLGWPLKRLRLHPRLRRLSPLQPLQLKLLLPKRLHQLLKVQLLSQLARRLLPSPEVTRQVPRQVEQEVHLGATRALAGALLPDLRAVPAPGVEQEVHRAATRDLAGAAHLNQRVVPGPVGQEVHKALAGATLPGLQEALSRVGPASHLAQVNQQAVSLPLALSNPEVAT